jgi:hypothetical protein
VLLFHSNNLGSMSICVIYCTFLFQNLEM